MKKILILTGRYLPGFKDGGPVRTLINLTELLGDEYDFHIAVLDRDHGDTEPYPDIKINTWNQVGKAKVWYYRPGEMNFSLIRKLSREVNMIYLCGFYDAYGYKTLLLRRFNLLYGKQVVLASMGSFSEGALSHKTLKKQTFICLCKLAGLFHKICWSVTSNYEKADVKRVIGKKTECIIAEDPPRADICVSHGEFSESGKIKLIFLSRITPQKNLIYIAQLLKKINVYVWFDIYGPVEDKEYWKACQKELSKLPKNIKWKYCGEADSNKVPDIFAKYDAFILPTMGENYGHVIFEALSVGCIPIISDQTPWNEIQKKNAGYVISLSESYKYCQTIEDISRLTVKQQKIISQNAIMLAKDKVEQAKRKTGYRDIFDRRVR